MRILPASAPAASARRFAAIAPRRDFFETIVIADYDAAAPSGPRPSTTGYVAAQVDASPRES
jgi:hypothetical protein